jgi:hypothetical protein
MILFNRKTLKQHLKPAPLPAAHFAILYARADMIRSFTVSPLKDIALDGEPIV